MEFNEKLQYLRKQKGVTQEDLANSLYVSRTAISKWESGRGYPNIDSLKRIAEYFSITIDELISSDEILVIAKEDTKQNVKRLSALVFSFLDISTLLFFFLPFFGQKKEGTVFEVSLLALNETQPYLKTLYFVIVILIILSGAAALIAKAFRKELSNQANISLILNLLALTLFILSKQPYAAVFLLVFLVIKVLLLRSFK